MTTSTSPASRFREFRERAGLTPEELARHLGLAPSCIRDIENHDEELAVIYSPSQLQQFCEALNIHPVELLGEINEPPVTPGELVRLIHEQREVRGMTIGQFGDAIGWDLNLCIEPPELLLEDMTIEGLQGLCRELDVDWRRVILSLS